MREVRVIQQFVVRSVDEATFVTYHRTRRSDRVLKPGHTKCNRGTEYVGLRTASLQQGVGRAEQVLGFEACKRPAF